jgi:4-hydroxy-3-methylbut-2-enyl diphosphate reductase
LDDISDVPVVITAHGIAPGVPQMLRAQGLKVIDATCPTVRRAQRAARSLAKAGFYVLIFGDVTHSEVQGLLGWAGERSSATLEPPNMESLPRHIGILSQTTQAQARFDRFVGQLISSGLGKLSELRIVNTICKATQERQDAALELAKRVDLMLVIGGRHSANATHLAESCVSTGVETHHIETAAELDPAWLINRRRIGIAAGTSTPDEVIDEVVLKLKEVV